MEIKRHPLAFILKLMSLSTPITDVQNRHVTIRRYTNQPVTDEMVDAILESARRGAPTSSNYQTYSVIVVRNPETKAKLAELAGGQEHVATCPVFFAFCADISRLSVACQMHGKELVRGLETTLVSSVDAALVGMSANTAAESFGLGVVMIGGMRNHPEEAARVLGLPDGCYVVFGMCIGWPDEALRPVQKPRLPQELIVHRERYSPDRFEAVADKLAAHDSELATHYESLGRNLDSAAWSGPIANRLSSRRRANLRPELERLGFVFE